MRGEFDGPEYVPRSLDPTFMVHISLFTGLESTGTRESGHGWQPLSFVDGGGTGVRRGGRPLVEESGQVQGTPVDPSGTEKSSPE